MLADQKIETALIDPGKAWQHGVSEGLNGKFRDECLSLEWSPSPRPGQDRDRSLAPALQHYNEVLPHSSLGYLTPAAFAAKLNERLPIPQRAGTLRDIGGFAPRPVAAPSLKEQNKSQDTPVLSS